MVKLTKIRKPKHGPEFGIQKDLIDYLEARGWLVERMTGNMFQKGIPDLYCFHPEWGERWIDVKNPGRYSFTKDQKLKWPKWESYKCGIWILTAATQAEYAKLFKPPNWRKYEKHPRKKLPDIDALMAQMK